MRPFLSLTQRRLEPARLVTPSLVSRSGRCWKHNTSKTENRPAGTKAFQRKMEGERGNVDIDGGVEKEDYSLWSQEKLIERVTLLETELRGKNSR